MLDGRIDGEAPAGKSIGSATTVKPKTKYTPSPKIDLIASYDYVKRKDVQVVDARTPREYSVGSVPWSKNIPYDTVLDGEKIKDQAVLRTLFADLSRDKPVAVYSNDGIKASVLWYALKLEGYNTSLCAGDNWATNLLRTMKKQESHWRSLGWLLPPSAPMVRSCQVLWRINAKMPLICRFILDTLIKELERAGDGIFLSPSPQFNE